MGNGIIFQQVFSKNYFIQIESFEYFIWGSFALFCSQSTLCASNELQMVLHNANVANFHFFSVVNFSSFFYGSTDCMKNELPINSCMKRTACAHAYPSKVSHIVIYIGFYTFCERQKWAYNSWFNHHFTIVCILISHAQPHSLSNLSSRVS